MFVLVDLILRSYIFQASSFIVAIELKKMSYSIDLTKSSTR
jgi:hypothetical protein